jgi:anti-sigma B factor antagonist
MTLNQPADGYVRPKSCLWCLWVDERGEIVNTNVSGIPAPRRRRGGVCETAAARTRPARRPARRCDAGYERALTTTVTRSDGVSAVVKVVGEIDIHTSRELRTVLLALADEGHTHIVADFSGVVFCDAAGLGALVAASNRVRERQGALRLTGVRPAQRRILRITRLDRLFRPYGSVDEALAR